VDDKGKVIVAGDEFDVEVEVINACGDIGAEVI
jgi:hypothetical protein